MNRQHTIRGRAELARALTLPPLLAALITAPAAAQTPPLPPPVSAIGDTVTVVLAPHYSAGPLQRTLLGAGWREVWLTPADVEVFGLGRFAGGVEWTRRGGGNQSITLHLEDPDGYPEYIFRSVNKFPAQALPPALNGTTVGWVVEDLISAMFPAAPLLVPPFLQALDILHVDPVLRIMPDDPRLEVYQDTFAGMLGTVEVQPNEAPGDEPGFAGSRKIKGTEEFLNDIEDSKTHTLDEREFLAARLVDFLINDSDRTRDNIRWARFGEEGDYHWRPLPVDRDWAFIDASGLVPRLAQGFYPKYVPYGPEYPPITSLTYASFLLDRRLLQRLTRADFQAVAEVVQAAITDDVIEASIARMPERWREETGAAPRMRESLRARRDRLPEIAMAFYDDLATDVDIRGTDESDRAVIERRSDGIVRVTITWPEESDRAGEVFYDRTFLPSETSEIRLYLHGGADDARVTGAASHAIVVRIIGGGGDDWLADEAGGATHLYDARGDNRLVRGPGTRVSTRAWDPPVPTEGLRAGTEWAPDWGGSMGWSPALDYGDASGVVLGFGPTLTSYGFRRLPYHWKLGARVLYATGDASLGVDLNGDYRFENSPLALTLAARATPFESFRFNGFGNDAPDAGDAGLVQQERIVVSPALTRHIGWRSRAPTPLVVGPNSPVSDDPPAPEGALRPIVGQLDLGPTFIWTDPHPANGSPLNTGIVGPSDGAWAGLRAAVALDQTDRDALPRRGWRVQASAAGYPFPGREPPSFAEAAAEAAAYLPLIGAGPHLALRGGGAVATGSFPVQHSPFVGGRTTLRGYRWQRFRGDAAAYGSAELRVPVAPVELLVRWNLGVFGLADAGRVWFEGASPGGWHTGYGGGIWLEALGKAMSVAYAQGEEGRVYIQLGGSF